jgi:CRISPR-associated protein Cmr6
MQHETTPATRYVSIDVNNIIGDIPSGDFNFGLYFNKWMYVADYNLLKQDSNWNRTKDLTCSTDDQTSLVRRNDFCNPNILLDNMDISVSLFNGIQCYWREYPEENNKGKYRSKKKKISISGHWNRQRAVNFLDIKNAKLNATAASFQQLGFKEVRIEAILQSPLVIGLGGEHPTEKGFKFDWNLGIPFIPASSLKGVVRLAFLVKKLNELQNEADAELFWRDVMGGVLPDSARNLFGCGVVGKSQEARRGDVIFMDAWPKTMPMLKAEIMNCHYPDYLNKRAEQGPTESQSPNPQKFWAVDSHDDKGKPVVFVFRAFLAPEACDLESEFKAALNLALHDHGLGAKTAIGHGRFAAKSLLSSDDSSELEVSGSGSAKKLDDDVEVVSAENVHMVWSPGNATITFTHEGNKIMHTGKEIIPSQYHKKLFKKPKSATAKKVVFKKLGNLYEVVSVE